MHDRLAGEPSADLTDCQHVVQFYDDEAFLHSAVVDFLEAGLRSSEPLVVIATPLNRTAFADRLRSRGHDVEAMDRAGHLTALDAREMLGTFMVDRTPDPDLFRCHVGAVFERVSAGRREVTIRAYGEMVNVLWCDGNPEGAIRLEELWNDLAATRQFSLMCGYAMGNFYKESHSEAFRSICAQHHHVVPTEAYVAAEDDGRLREIAVLQQRARALETEIAHRRELEGALRQALADRERAQNERERLLARERAARGEAEAAGRLKDEFLAVLSHELRTPLNAILGWTQIANDPASDIKIIRRALDVIQRNARIQLHVTDDLLDVSRILTGKMLVASDPIDLAEVVEAALETVRPAATAKNIEMASRVDDHARLVVGDRDRLQQILWNLLSNAIKFTPVGGRVGIELRHAGDHAEIVVHDTGQGITPDFVPHVFERFRQADTGTTRRHGGLGLGLAVVRYLVEAHGGTVRVESEGLGRGATFVVTLRLRDVAAPTPQEPTVTTSSLEGARVLVVDDDEDAGELFSYVLTEAGAVVETVAAVDQALRLVDDSKFDVLVGDIGLPDQDGYSLIEAIRSHQRIDVRTMCAIAVTSYAGDHYRARAISAGFDSYIAKPVDPPRLTELIDDLLSRKRRTARLS